MSALIQRLKQPLVRVLAAFTGPRIVYGWANADGSWCAHTRVSTHTCFEGQEGLKLGDHVFIGHFNRIDGSNGLLIEEGVQVTNYASILSHSSHKSVRVMGRRYVNDPNPAGYVRKSTRIGAYSFIGPHSVIAPGSQIGKGVIVQGYSFVSGVVPDFAIVGPQAQGKPAVVMGDSREIDRALLQRHPELHALYAQWAGKDNLRRALNGHASAPDAASDQEPA
ncbi:MAG: acyltransferase [Aquabacterium sp.]|uniref:acyltransferase n=1 Tax=Aquabacterium sp. TaxID=1872578 RepID=UPI0025BA9FA5|nr:acyltransferase [Aquabacterium sp.]MBI3381886.1 acyltransferase [Aquabacterium sp.]